MKVVDKKIDELIPYINNPRKNDDAVDDVAASIKEFGFKVPIVIDKDNVIVAGHTRYKASKKLGLKEVPCIIADDLTEAQIKAFRLADNKVSEKAEWDFELLELEMEDIDLDMGQFGFEEESENKYEDSESGSVAKRFIVPPFSVFDSKSGVWQNRKKYLNESYDFSTNGRKDGLLGEGLGKLYKNIGGKNKTLQSGTSCFDPVICEVIYKWFNVDGGSILDPFAGGAVRGILAEAFGYKYYGIDVRQEQVDENYEVAKKNNVSPTWYCDDSRNVGKYIEDDSVDLIFSCPPYADLEVYSDDENDISNMKYDDFLKAYKEIIKKSLEKLKNNRFAVFVVGDVRDKKTGFYYDFISDTKKAFIENGANLYNEIIYLEMIGTGALTCTRQFNSSRTVRKVNQNILVFYKGDKKNIKENFKELDLSKEDVSEFISNEEE